MAGPTISHLGTPDMKPITIGGPSAMGEAKGGAIEFLLSLVRQGIYYFGGQTQLSKAQQDVKALGARIERDRTANPTRGVLVSLQFIVLQGSPEAAGKGDAFRYVGYLYGMGMTTTEARADELRHGMIRPGTRSNESYAYQPLWFPPKSPVGTYKRPFPVIAQGCFVDGRVALQDVKWTTLQGFDDEGTSHLSGGGTSYHFDILNPPTSLVTAHGAVGPVKVPVVQRMVGSGGRTIPVVNLDTLVGHVTAAMIFPADIATELAFARTRATEQHPLGTIRGLVNFDKVRWVRPENIHLL